MMQTCKFSRFARVLGGAGLFFSLLACDLSTKTSPRPLVRTPPAPAPAPVQVTKPPSERSQKLGAYYAQVQSKLLSQGFLRTDRGLSTPFYKHNLVQNFIDIGVHNEFTAVDGVYTEASSEGRVRRWNKPIKVSMHFGATVPKETRLRDEKLVDDYTDRLSHLSGVPISISTKGAGNFHVAVLSVDEIENFGPQLKRLIPDLDDGVIRQISSLPRPIYCSVYTFSRADQQNNFHSAVAIIRAEHPDLLRSSCYHEEIAQGLGLSNDSPLARPSIFNDNDEFALLTHHDEMLLRLLYDPRLPLGSTPAQARPIVRQLASELLDGEI